MGWVLIILYNGGKEKKTGQIFEFAKPKKMIPDLNEILSQ